LRCFAGGHEGLLPAGLTLALWVKGLHPALPGWPCPLRALTGLPCPTCFLTRATAAALTGQLATSVRWHAFGPLVAVALLLWSVRSLRRGTASPPALPRGLLVGGGALLLLYWLLRLGLSATLPADLPPPLAPGLELLRFPPPANG
jgi:hypothetical protein